MSGAKSRHWSDAPGPGHSTLMDSLRAAVLAQHDRMVSRAAIAAGLIPTDAELRRINVAARLCGQSFSWVLTPRDGVVWYSKSLLDQQPMRVGGLDALLSLLDDLARREPAEVAGATYFIHGKPRSRLQRQGCKQKRKARRSATGRP